MPQDNARLMEALRAADAAGDVDAARRFAEMIRAAPAEQAPAQEAPERGLGTRAVDAARGFADMASFGLADEIGAAVRSAPALLDGGDFGETYAATLKDERARDATGGYERMAGQVAGGFVPGFGAAKLATKGMQSLPNIIKWPLFGGSGGAAYGAGSGEGGAGERAQSAAVGGAVGLGVGATMGVAAPVAKGVINSLSGAGKQGRAADRLANALRRDDLTPQTAQQRLAELGPASTLADLGQNVRGLSRAVANLPGKGKAIADDVYTARQTEAGTRIIADLKLALNSSGDDFYQQMETTAAQRSAAAKPLYEQAYSQPVMFSKPLDEFLETPIADKAFQNARSIWSAENAAAGLRGDAPDAPQWFVDLMSNGKVQDIRAVPNTRVWDYMIRGLDDVLEGYRDKTTGRLVLDTAGRSIQQVRSALEDAVTTANPALKDARNAWAGPSRAMNAMERGRSFISRDGEISAKELQKLGASEQEYFRHGVARGIRDIVMKVPDGSNVVRRLLKSPEVRDKLKTVFPDDGTYNQFIKDMQREQTFNVTKNEMLTGSRTTPLAAEMQDAGLSGVGGIAQDVASAARGSGAGALSLAGRVASPIYNRARAGVNEGTRDALAEMLFSPDPAIKQLALDQLLRSGVRQQVRDSTLGGLTLGGNAALLGQ